MRVSTQRREGAKARGGKDATVSYPARPRPSSNGTRTRTRDEDENERAVQDGFSLIELMVVIVLIGIISAMVLPAMKGSYDDVVLRSTARKLVDALTLANSRAVSINQMHRVRLDRKSQRYLVERKVHDAQQGYGFVALRDVSGGEGEMDARIMVEVRKTEDVPLEGEAPLLPSSERSSTDSEAIAFYADGTAEPAEIILRDRQNFRLALRVNSTTARVQIVELGGQ